MAEGCRQLGIPFEPDIQGLREWIQLVMDKNELSEAYIRYTVTAGEDILGLPSAAYKQPNQLLYIKALPVTPTSLYTEGKELQLLNHRRNTPEGPVRLKSLHYMNNILAKRELAGYPSAERGAEGLMLTAQGEVAEGIVSNIFLSPISSSIPPISPPGFFRELPGKWCLSWQRPAISLNKAFTAGNSLRLRMKSSSPIPCRRSYR